MKRERSLLLLLLSTLLALQPSLGSAWTWDDEDTSAKDELEIQLSIYRKQVENGMTLSERLSALDRLIKLYDLKGRDYKFLLKERDQLVADQSAIDSVSTLSRQRAQELFRDVFELVRIGEYEQAQQKVIESEKLNPTDKLIADLHRKIDAVVLILKQVPADLPASDQLRRGVAEFLQNEPNKALNFLVYSEQKNPGNSSVAALIDLVKQTFPSAGSVEMLDGQLNLIDQKLQKALEKVYSGEYLVAAKECQEVLDLEPGNPLALTRLGSVYYAMGQVKQARIYWAEALRIEPKNEVLKNFMEQTAAEADRAPSQALTYKVQRGDTLQIIAQKIYNDKKAWRQLYDANKSFLKNPYKLYAGQILVIPPQR